MTVWIGGMMSFFSDEDNAANQKATAEKAAVEQQHRRNAPRVAEHLVDLLEAAARSTFRGGREVREIRADDGKSNDNFVDKDILTEALIPIIEQRFRRNRSEFTLHLFQSHDWEDRDCAFQGNSVSITFNEPLR